MVMYEGILLNLAIISLPHEVESKTQRMPLEPPNQVS